jgi:hypothetical protein
MFVNVPGKTKDNAIALLAAADDLGIARGQVLTTSEAFRVPLEVAEKSGLDFEDPREPTEDDGPFEPVDHGTKEVTAKLDELTVAADEAETDEAAAEAKAEYNRILQAEVEGKNRKTVTEKYQPLTDEPADPSTQTQE